MGKLVQRDFGHMTYTPLGSDKAIAVIPTHKCCHCDRRFVMRQRATVTQALTPFEARVLQAQGKVVRGVCGNCGGIFCGPDCQVCIHPDQKLENIEAGRPEDWKPIRVFT